MVDDEESLIDCMKEVLEMEDYLILTAGNGQVALDLYKQKQDEIDLVICDKGLPELDGEEVYHEIRKIKPQQKFILATGSMDIDESLLKKSDPHLQIMYKPYKIADLIKVAGEMTGKTKANNAPKSH